MTVRDFSEKLALQLRTKPTKQTVADVVKQIKDAKTDGKPLSASQVDKVLEYLEASIGTLTVITESFDNSETLTLISQVRALIKQNNNK